MEILNKVSIFSVNNEFRVHILLSYLNHFSFDVCYKEFFFLIFRIEIDNTKFKGLKRDRFHGNLTLLLVIFENNIFKFM